MEKNKHFHSIERGCKVKSIYTKEKQKTMIEGFCQTHKKKICRCGWEWGYHHCAEPERKKTIRERFDNSYIQTWDKKSKRYKVKHIDKHF